MVLRRVALGVPVLALFLAISVQSVAAAPTRSTTAIAYGDSLLWESKRQLLRQLPGAGPMKVIVRAVPAYAPCDWSAQMRADLTRVHPSLVLLESAGLTVSSPCMASPSTGSSEPAGSPEWMEKSSADLDWFFGSVTATGARAVFVAAPPTVWTATIGDEAILGIAIREAARFPGASVDLGPALAVTTDGSYAPELPCLPGETAKKGCVSGQIIVRSPDGVHFCPKPMLPRNCSVYSSGEVRYASAIVTAIGAS